MTYGGRYTTTLLFLGDLVVFALSLWLTLLVRYVELPTVELLADHIPSFLVLFVLWTIVFTIAGLYSKRAILFKSELPGMILRAQVLNILLAALFFFLVPGIGIAPKTNLILYLGISLIGIFVWRLALVPRLTEPSVRERAVLLAGGPEAHELLNEVNGNPRYHLQFVTSIDPASLSADFETLRARLLAEHATMLVVDAEHPQLRQLLVRLYEFSLVEQGPSIVGFYEMYEEVFDRVPLSLLDYEWLLANVASSRSVFYEALKRAIDIVGGVLMGVLTVLVTPLVFVAMRLEGPGPLFIRQERIGKNGVRMFVYKFRSMRFNDQGKWKGEGENYVTNVGAFLRQTSLDEFPQFVNVLRGDLSLIGPRNDIAGLAVRLAEAIPYYNLRYAVTPGITGWAQINQRYEPGNISPQSIEETKVRLAYDFYYLKNRSLALDIVIALKTVKRMFFRVSSW